MYRLIATVFMQRLALGAIILVADVIIARALGPEGKGILQLLVVTPGLIAAVASLGCSYALNRLGHGEPGLAASVYASTVLVGLAGSGLVIAALWPGIGGLHLFLYPNLPPQFAAMVWLSLLIVPVLVWFELTGMLVLTAGVATGFSRMRLARRLILLAAVTAGVLLIDLASYEAFVKWLVGWHAGALFAASGYGLWLAGYRPAWPYPKWKMLLHEALSSYVSRISQKLQSRLDVVLLAALGTAQGLGWYAIATGLAEILLLVSCSVSNVLFARNSAGTAMHSQVLRLTAVVLLCLAVVAGLTGYFVIPLIYGARFEGSVAPFLILLPGIVALGLTQSMIPVLVQAGHGGWLSVSSAVGLAGNVAANLLLIPVWDARGAAAASSISYILTFAMAAARLFEGRRGLHGVSGLLLKREDIGFVVSRVRRFVRPPGNNKNRPVPAGAAPLCRSDSNESCQ